LLDELGTAMEAWCDVGVACPLVTPAEDTPFHRAQPRRRRQTLSAAGELAHLDHAVNESWAPTEALGYVADGYFLSYETLDSAFDRTEVLDVNHDLRPTYVVEGSPFRTDRESWISVVAVAVSLPTPEAGVSLAASRRSSVAQGFRELMSAPTGTDVASYEEQDDRQVGLGFLEEQRRLPR